MPYSVTQSVSRCSVPRKSARCIKKTTQLGHDLSRAEPPDEPAENRTQRCDFEHVARSSAAQFCGAIEIAERGQDYAAGREASIASSREDVEHSFGPEVSLS